MLYEPNILILDILTATGDLCIDPTVVEEWGVDEFGLRPSGTGPFMFDEWVRDEYISVVRNPDYNWAPVFTGHEGPAKLEKMFYECVLIHRGVNITEVRFNHWREDHRWEKP